MTPLPPALASAGFFLLYLIAVTLTHALWNWTSPNPGAPQGRALLTVLLNAGTFLAAAGVWVWRTGASLSWLPYLGICLLCLAYCYWSLICLSESGRRYKIAHLVYTREAETPERILELYSRDVVVLERIVRLLQWGEIEGNSARYVCRRGRMYRASRLVHAWARLLGFRWFT